MDLPKIELDSDGYPTEQFLEAIRNYRNEVEPMLKLLQEAWTYESAKNPRPGIWTFATLGWSGNESLMEAFEQTITYFVASLSAIRLPGGLYCFATTPEAEKEMQELHALIVKWAWRENKETCGCDDCNCED